MLQHARRMPNIHRRHAPGGKQSPMRPHRRLRLGFLRQERRPPCQPHSHHPAQRTHHNPRQQPPQSHSPSRAPAAAVAGRCELPARWRTTAQRNRAARRSRGAAQSRGCQNRRGRGRQLGCGHGQTGGVRRNMSHGGAAVRQPGPADRGGKPPRPLYPQAGGQVSVARGAAARNTRARRPGPVRHAATGTAARFA